MLLGWSVKQPKEERNNTGSTNGTSTADATDSLTNGRTLVAIGNEIDQDFLFGHKTIREESF
jgi:hypothetical protein